jgi:hypothetical protein
MYSTPVALGDTPNWLIREIKRIINTNEKTPKNPELRFDLSDEAATHNMKLLQKYDNDLQRYLMDNHETFIGFGSEFRRTSILEPLLLHHPNWRKFKTLLEKGSDWEMDKISETDRLAKNKEFATRGNHKSAITYDVELQKTIQKELKQGWMFPLPLSYISTLKHGELAPVGMDDKQWNELPDGLRERKYRMTHDQSFETININSVNRRVQRNTLTPLYYGGCLSRLIHYILSVRARHPKVKIFGGKSDFKAAYRRISLHGDTAAKCSIMYKNWGLPSLRLTFGGSPCPNEFCVVSELCTDLANDILHCPEWDQFEVFSPHTHTLPEPVELDMSIPFGQAKELDVDVPDDDWGRIDDFIDDGIAIVPDLGQNRNRAVQALLLAIHTICRPLDNKETITREDCLSLGKLKEEGQLSEEPIILGWLLNTRLLTIALPKKKANYWLEELKNVMISKRISYKNLETLVGRLNHAAAACPLFRYFLNRLRNLLTTWNQAQVSKRCVRYLSKQVLEDLKLWHNVFLPKIATGMSLNLTSFRRPSYICWSDACPQGMGGYDFIGRAWRFQIPPDFRQAVLRQNNSLEFVASILSVWVAIQNEYAEKETCFLALGDNSSAVGWLHKANIDESKNLPLHLAARKYAEILIEADCCVYSQHINGIHNNVADALSRRFDLSDEDLTSFILSSFPSQVPKTFKIYQLPQNLSSWAICWLQKYNEITELRKTQETRKLEYGNDGWSTQKSSNSITTSGSKVSYLKTEQNLWERSPQHCEEDNFLARTKRIWQQEQCKRPWQNWVRSLGQTWGTTPHMVWDLKDSIPVCCDNSKE